MGLLDMAVGVALNQVRDKVVNPKLTGIGEVEAITYKDKQLCVKMRLEDLEEHPLEVACTDIELAPDGSNVKIGSFKANKKFMQAALDQYVAGKPIAIPEGGARLAVLGAKKVLGL